MICIIYIYIYDQFANKSHILSSLFLIFTKLHYVHPASRSSISVCNNKCKYYRGVGSSLWLGGGGLKVEAND